MTTTPDPQIVNELALEVANIALHDAVHVDQWISAVVNSRFGNECSQFRAPLHTAVARRMAVAKPSWPAEQPQEFECEVCTKPITAYPCILCEHEPDPWKKPDERDAQLADLAIELDAVNDNADEIAKQRSEYREEIMRLRERVRELKEVQSERDGATQAVAEAVSILEGMLNEDAWAYDAGRARNVLLDYFARDLDALEARTAKAGE